MELAGNAGWGERGRGKERRAGTGVPAGCLTSLLFFVASFKVLRGSSGSVQFFSQPSRDCR